MSSLNGCYRVETMLFDFICFLSLDLCSVDDPRKLNGGFNR